MSEREQVATIKDPTSNAVNGGLPMSLQAALYQAMSTMASYSLKMQQSLQHYQQEYLEAFGGWSKNSKGALTLEINPETGQVEGGIIANFLNTSIASAKESGQSIRNEAWGNIAAGLFGVATLGCTLGASALYRDPENTANLKDAQEFQQNLATASNASVELRGKGAQANEDRHVEDGAQRAAQSAAADPEVRVGKDGDVEMKEISRSEEETAAVNKSNEEKRATKKQEIEQAQKAKDIENEEIQKERKRLIEARINHWASDDESTDESKLANFNARNKDGSVNEEEAKLNKDAAQHLRTSNHTKYDKVCKNLAAYKTRLEKKQEKLDEKFTRTSQLLYQVSNAATPLSQGTGNIFKAQQQVEYLSDQARADVLKTVQGQESSSIDDAKQRMNSFGQQALDAAAMYGQLGQIRG